MVGIRLARVILFRMTRAKALAVLLLAASAFALAACDPCGHPVSSISGDQMMACKSGAPR